MYIRLYNIYLILYIKYYLLYIISYRYNSLLYKLSVNTETIFAKQLQEKLCKSLECNNHARNIQPVQITMNWAPKQHT